MLAEIMHIAMEKEVQFDRFRVVDCDQNVVYVNTPKGEEM
jgi:hypothetical protein